MESSKKSPDPLYHLRGHESVVNAVKFYPKDKDILLSGGGDGNLIFWNLSRRRPEHIIPNAHTLKELGEMESPVDPNNSGSEIVHVDVMQDKPLSQGRNGLIKIWDIEKLVSILTIRAETFSFCKCAVYEPSESTSLIAFPKEDPHCIEIWDIRENKAVHHLKCDSNDSKLGMCMSLKIFQPKKTSDIIVASSYENGSIYFSNLKTGTIMMSSKLHSQPALCFDIDDEGAQGVSGSAGTNIVIFSLDYEKESCSIAKEFTVNHEGIATSKIRQDQKIFATGGWDHRIRIYNWKKLKPLAILKGHTEGVFCLDFSPLSNLMASGSKDKRIAIWSIY